MKNSRDIYLKIRVVNKDTKAEFIHSSVPIDHVEMIRLNPNLNVEVLGRSRGRYKRQNSESLNESGNRSDTSS